MSTDYSNRDWEKQPYGVEDGILFEKFEADLMDELEKAKGAGHQKCSKRMEDASEKYRFCN